MGIGIYELADPSSELSNDGLFGNPFVTTFDGITGGTINKKIYVRNDNTTYYYTGITVQPVYLSGTNIINSSDGFSWKLVAGDEEPLEEQWDLVSAGNSINIPSIGESGTGDNTTYEPFWVRIVVPKGAPVKSYSGIKLRLSFTENLV